MSKTRRHLTPLAIIAAAMTVGLTQAASPVAASPPTASHTAPVSPPVTSPQLVGLYELATPIDGYFYTASVAERDTMIRDHGFRFVGQVYSISRTTFPGSTGLHRLRAADRDAYLLALPDEADALQAGGTFVDQGVVGYIDEDPDEWSSRLSAGGKLAAVFRISKAGVWRVVNTRLMDQLCLEPGATWTLDGLLASVWSPDGA
ncbi:hypothetical protein [Nonomuraea helvata]|uniref:Secreted protein n=1 Tax=Nonomuraea helvata TaxID=37484 RepID=A0ABV5S6L7_9ACTN